MNHAWETFIFSNTKLLNTKLFARVLITLCTCSYMHWRCNLTWIDNSLLASTRKTRACSDAEYGDIQDFKGRPTKISGRTGWQAAFIFIANGRRTSLPFHQESPVLSTNKKQACLTLGSARKSNYREEVQVKVCSRQDDVFFDNKTVLRSIINIKKGCNICSIWYGSIRKRKERGENKELFLWNTTTFVPCTEHFAGFLPFTLLGKPF